MLTSLDAVKEFLGIKIATDDPLLTRLIKDASGLVVAWLGRDITTQSYTQRLDGKNGFQITPSHYPITAVTTVKVDEVPILAAADSLAAGFMFDENTISIKGSRFNAGIKNVLITYVAGFSSTPPDIEQACIDLVTTKYKERDRIGLDSKGLSGETTAFATRDLPNRTKMLLNQYKKVDLA